MKVTKVDGMRIAVVGRKSGIAPNVVMYKVVKRNNDTESLTNVIEERVKSANRRYKVFFAEGTRKETKNLEKCFTCLMKQMERRYTNEIKKAYHSGDREQIKSCTDEQIEYLANYSGDFVIGKDRKIRFSELKCDVSDLGLNKAIGEMRGSLKRGTNAGIAKSLLTALAQGNQSSYKEAVLELKRNDGEAFRKFIDAVNKDYFKTNLLRSIERHDVKVQVGADDAVLNLANVGNTKGSKQALTKIMENYASSQAAAKETLLEIKKVLFAYFFDFENIPFGNFLTVNNPWKIPKEDVNLDLAFDGLFDEGFAATAEYAATEKKVAGATLDELFKESKRNIGKIKERVKFVNYGKYLSLLSETDDEDDIRKFWLGYIKEYIEKNYVKKELKNVEAATFGRLVMFKECWRDAVRYLCGKYIDLGKAVYHFAMPGEKSCKCEEGKIYGVVQPDYVGGISSFAYEAIKAEETLQRNIANTTVAAVAAFSRAVLRHDVMTEERNEDILFIKDIKEKLREDALQRVLKYYGGSSIVNKEGMNVEELVPEMISHFSLIRNESFHYTPGKTKDISVENAVLLLQHDKEAYAQLVRQKYYANNAAMFYHKEDIVKLVAEKLYKEKRNHVAQVPAFRSIWQRKELPKYINEMKRKHGMHWVEDAAVKTKFEGTLYFLLKEIYYNDFICNDAKAKKLFLDAVKSYKGTAEVTNSAAAAENFGKFIAELAGQNMTFAQICQTINQEYNQQNMKKKKGKDEKDSFAHYKMLLPKCVKAAFEKYVAENQPFIVKPAYDEKLSGEQDYLDECVIDCGMNIGLEEVGDKTKRKLAWFTFAHFIHPRQLNFLVGDFKSYIQYRKDVQRRAGYAKHALNEKEKTKVKNDVKNARDVLEVLEFVRVIAGRVSNNFEDYYRDTEEYAEYLSHYIDFASGAENKFPQLVSFCKYTLDSGRVIDIYADEKNPKVLRNVEIARMYAGGDIVLPGFSKVKEEEIKEFYAKAERVAKLLSKGLCETKDEQREVIKQQQLKGRITLNDVTEVFSMINDMLGQLVSLAYLRERDKMYLLLGYYYMALRSADNWSTEKLDTLDENGCKVLGGKVLYQVVGMFDYGTPFLYYSTSDKKWVEKPGGISISGKEERFKKEHKTSLECAMMLFEKETHSNSICALRNYVDHFKYYANFEKSITELYTEFYTNFFSYSTKLRKSVLTNFRNVLEKYFLENEVRFAVVSGGQEIMPADGLFSKKFTYKLKPNEQQKNNNLKPNRQQNNNSKQKNAPKNECELNAKSESFVKSVKGVLNYKRELSR